MTHSMESALLWLHGVKEQNIYNQAHAFERRWLVHGDSEVAALRQMEQQYRSQFGAQANFRAMMLEKTVPWLGETNGSLNDFGRLYSGLNQAAIAQGAAPGTAAYHRIMRNGLYPQFTDEPVPENKDVNDFRFNPVTEALEPMRSLTNALPFAQPLQSFGNGLQITWPNQV